MQMKPRLFNVKFFRLPLPDLHFISPTRYASLSQLRDRNHLQEAYLYVIYYRLMLDSVIL
jgi:hypothetical protein